MYAKNQKGDKFQLYGEDAQFAGQPKPNDGDAVVYSSALGKARFGRPKGVYFDVRDFGARVDGVTDDTDSVQGAINAAYAFGGGTVMFPSGICYCGSLILKYGVSMVGIVNASFTELTTVNFGSTLKLKNGATGPLITSDQVNGYVRQASSVGPGNQLYQNSTIKNLTFLGNKANQTTLDADLLRLFQVWNVVITDCNFMDAKGFGLRALDCNVVNLTRCFFVYAPIYGECLADCIFQQVEVGGAHAAVYPLLWLDGSADVSWQNIISGGLVFNNAGNVALSVPTFTVNTGTDVVTTSSAHGFVDGTPVSLSTTGTLPAGSVSYKTYYVSVLSSTTFKLAATRLALSTSTFIDFTTTGSGTHSVSIGKNAGMYLSGALNIWNTFTGMRFDQNYGHGVWMEGAKNNTISSCLINTSGLGNSTGQYGVYLSSSSTDNNLVGNNLSGQVISSGGYNSNQTVGIFADDSSTGTKLAGNRSADHSVADVSLGAYSGYLESTFYGPQNFSLAQGAPTLGTVASGRYPAWLLDSATTESVATSFPVPLGWTTIRFVIHWANAGAGAGDVRWSIGTCVIANGGTIGAESVSSEVTGTAGALDVMVHSVGSPTVTLTSGSTLFMRVKRVGGDAADTLGNDAALVGIRIERVT